MSESGETSQQPQQEITQNTNLPVSPQTEVASPQPFADNDSIEGKPMEDGSAAKFHLDEINNQWMLVTEAVRRDLLTKPTVRNVLTQFCTTPVSELLPQSVFHTIETIDERIAQLSSRYSASLGAYLNIAPVSEDRIVPDITYSPHLTEEEKSLVATRFRFARDVKTLALAAELEENKSEIQQAGNEILLPSGTKIVIDAEGETRRDLLQPHIWQKRTQLKDRVYEIEVNNRRYILKERKTSRHTDTKKGGHREGRSTADEYEVARSFNQNASVTSDTTIISWEKPIGYVEYPDGYSFTVFEFEEGLMGDYHITPQLARAIQEHREQFEDEYHRVSSLTSKYLESDLAFLSSRNRSAQRKANLWNSLAINRWRAPALSYEAFSRVKALKMQRNAVQRMKEIIFENGYEAHDLDGYAFRINTDKEVKLEVVGFDFEYFFSITKEEISERKAHLRQHDREVEMKFNIGVANWEGNRINKIDKAAYLALLELEGGFNDEQEGSVRNGKN